MRALLLAMLALPLGMASLAWSEEAAPSERSVNTSLLPLFERNRCAVFSDRAEQIFCGDPELSSLSEMLSMAIQHRLDRLPNRRLAIEENVEWIRNRNSSCGIFKNQSAANQDLVSIKACLLKETADRIEMLADPNFDCLATNTTAGMLICSDPSLAIAKTDLNAQVVGLISKLKGDDARQALAEYERWSRQRDRKCDLDDKDNVPLEELTSSAACLADYMEQKTTELAAAKGDPKRIFGRPLFSPSPDADAVDLCVAQIHSANACENFLRVSRVLETDSEVTALTAQVTAAIEMVVSSPFAVCSPIASRCTGTCWDLKSGKAKPMPGSAESIFVAHRLTIEKSFAFQKVDGGGWRCNTTALQPIDVGIAMSGP